jgi:hypothetical protein
MSERVCKGCYFYSPCGLIWPEHGTCSAEAPMTAEQYRLEATVWPRSVSLKRHPVHESTGMCAMWRTATNE